MAESYSCPFCDAARVELISLYGSQLLTSQYRCAACGSYFEGIRDEDLEAEPVTPAGVEHGS